MKLRELGDGRALWLDPLTYGRARLSIGPAAPSFYDDCW